MFFKFEQNNSAGYFCIDDKRGMGPVVWVEAKNPKEANKRALDIGIYFDGVRKQMDCECCGDRWYKQWEEPGFKVKGHRRPIISREHDFSFHRTVYVHMKDGVIARIRAKDVPKGRSR